MNGKDYVKNAVKLAKDLMDSKELELVYGKKCKRPMLKDYRPELDISPELGPRETQEYQQFNGVARWAVETGRTDMLYEVSLLSSQLALPRKGHMKALMGIFAYLDKNPHAMLVFDDATLKINPNTITETN
mmetsp:Transcript_34844/g.53424  ORF Transcript_34844/g.53424 Transcript_34844/m.53424 type:complete len:131 (-) Transcript_34844:586-978(-)